MLPSDGRGLAIGEIDRPRDMNEFGRSEAEPLTRLKLRAEWLDSVDEDRIVGIVGGIAASLSSSSSSSAPAKASGCFPYSTPNPGELAGDMLTEKGTLGALAKLPFGERGLELRRLLVWE